MLRNRVGSIGLAVLTAVSIACGWPGSGDPPQARPSSSALDTPTPAPTLSPSPTAGSATSSPAVSPTPSVIKTSSKPTPLGDLTIVRVGGCVWYLDSTGKLWLRPTLQVTWTGPVPFPYHAFNMRTNPGNVGAGGPVPESVGFDLSPDPRIARFTWAIGGVSPSVFTGHTVDITVNVDPPALNQVSETNEANNTILIRFHVPAGGYSTTEQAISCD